MQIEIRPKTSSPMWLLVFFFFAFFMDVQGQQLKWAKVFPLPQTDKLQCIIRDNQFIYAAGSTRRNAPGSSFFKVVIYKINPENGDTIFVKDLGFSGVPYSMTLDQAGRIRFNCEIRAQPWDYPAALILNSEGEILEKDTLRGYPYACTMGKDGSLVVVGSRGRTGGLPGQICMYFQRIDANGILQPWVELPYGTKESIADRVEQLPNGNYFISGRYGKKVLSCEVDSVGGNPQFHEWYQTPDSTALSAGTVGRVGSKDWFLGVDGNKTFVSVLDSARSKVWKKQDPGILAPPQGMKDSSVVFGYSSGFAPFNYFYKFKRDSTLVWFFNMRDCLTQRGLPNGIDYFTYAYFPDESAVFAGTYNSGGATGRDPIFMRIANVGTPVSVLEKPKSGPLQNETLAPWPNPTGGTLYLKQHFDKAEIRLYNLAGKEMGSYKINFAQSIDISAFPQGVYFYRAVIDGKGYSGKVVKK